VFQSQQLFQSKFITKKNPDLNDPILAWKPRYSGRYTLVDCVWLARLLDKARAAQNSTLGEYLFGERDYLDAKLLHFLRLSDCDIIDIVVSEPDDEQAAQLVLQRANKSRDECIGFSRRFTRKYGPFLAMLDADEGRRRPTFGTKLMKVIYNLAVFPLARALYHRARLISHS
jgi:Domain of unknown function (DUF5069)